jgi:flagellar biosynthesis/type III secretory pathway chaperone
VNKQIGSNGEGMHHLFGELSGILCKQLELTRQLLFFIQKQSVALSQNRAAADLFELAREQKELSDIIAANEFKRKELQGKIIKILRISSDTGLKELISYARDSMQEDLKLFLKELGHCIKEIARQNNLNRIMTLKALSFNQAVLKMLNLDAGPTYHINGKLHKQEASFSLLNRTV